MLFDLLVGVVLALAYLVGALIYFGTKDECIPFVNRFKRFSEAMNHNFYLITVASALVASWLVTKPYSELAIALFIVPIVQISLKSAGKKNREVILLAVKSAALFITIYALSQSLLISELI